MSKINIKNRREEAVRPGTRFASAVLSVLAFLVLSALLAVPALARPCCEFCDGPEPYDDPDCWSVCQPCSGGGGEPGDPCADVVCPGGAACFNGRCIGDPCYCLPGQWCVNGQCTSSSAVAGELSGSQSGVSDSSTLAAKLSDSQPGASDSSTSVAELSASQCFVEDVAEDDLAQER